MEGERELPDLCKYSAHSLFAEAISWDQYVCFRLAGIAPKLCVWEGERGLPKGVVDTRAEERPEVKVILQDLDVAVN